MNAEQPTLSYGVEPKAGSVVDRESSDGTIRIEVLPKSPAQLLPAIAWGVACILLPLAATGWFWLRGRVEGWFLLVGAFVVLHLLIAFPAIVYWTGRQRLYIVAGPQGLSIWTTQLGDEVRYDWDRQVVEDVYVRHGREGETSQQLNVRLRGSAEPTVVPIFRDARTIEEIVRRVRRAMGFQDSAP